MNIPHPGPLAPPLPARRRRHRPGRLATTAALLLAALPAAAQVPPEVIARALSLAGEAAAALAPKDARVATVPGALDPRLTLAPCGRVEPYLISGAPVWGASRVGLRCTDGHARWNVSLPVTVQVWAPAVVAMSALPAGARLAESQLGRAEVDWAAAASPAFDAPQPLVGRGLSRPLAAGQTLRASDLQARQWFAPGDSVRVVAAGAGYTVTGEGEALGPGVEGQSARVRTESGRVLVGRPVGDHCIEVSL